MKNRGMHKIILIIVMFSLSGIIFPQGNMAKKSVKDFVEYLKSNKEILKYESFGSFEHQDQIEVRIYCNEESKNLIEKNIPEYNYKNLEYKNHTTATGVLYVIFEKPISGSGQIASHSEKKKVKCPRKVPVKVENLKTGVINEYKLFNNSISDGGKTAVVSPVSGKVASVLFKSGDKIGKGDVLLKFDTSDIDRKIDDTGIQLKEWQIKLKKRRGWKVRSPRAESQAQRKIDELGLKLNELKEKKEKSALSSNISGQVISIIEPGIEIKEGDQIAVVLDNSEMTMEIPSDDIALFEGVGTLKVNISNKGVFEGEVKREAGRLFLVINNENLELTSSDKASFTILSKVYKDVPVLEKSVLYSDSNGKYVYSVLKNRAVKKYLKTGIEENGNVMVVSGLNPGDSVIVTKDNCLKEKKKIKIVEGDIPVKKIKKKAKKDEKKRVIKKKKEKTPEIEKKVVYKKPEAESDKIRYVKKRAEGEWDEFDNCPSVAKVMVRTLETGSVFGEEKFISRIKSGLINEIRSEISGKVSNVLYSKGDVVNKGDLLVEFDVNDLEQRKFEKQKQLDQWKKVLSDVESWTERNEQLEIEIKDKIRKISQDLALLHGNIVNSKLFAQATGTVEFIVKSGNEVKENDLIVKILEKNRVRIPVEMKGDVSEIKNLRIEVTFEGLSEKYSGKIVESDTGKEVIVEDSFNRLSAGMSAVVKIFGNFENKVILSNGELLKDDSGYFAFVVNGSKAERRNLDILSFGKNKVAVRSGLKPGEELIVTNLECLENNKKIKVYGYDAITGKKVFRGKKSPTDIKREKVEKKKFSVGIGGAYIMVSDEVFKDVYGSGGFSGMFTLSYKPAKNIGLFFNVLYLPKSGSTLSVTKVDLSMYEFNLGIRYLFGRSEKMLPFVGIALNSLAVKEKSDEINLNTAYKTSTGATVLAGVFYEITPGWDFLIDIRYDLNKMRAGEGLEDIVFSGVRALIGVVFRF